MLFAQGLRGQTNHLRKTKGTKTQKMARKDMKKTLTVLSTILCFSALQVIGAQDSRFQPGEWEVSPFATYVDKTGDKWGVGASLTYYLNTYFGVGASTYWTDFGGTFFDNAAAEGYFRIPVLKSLAPYAVGSIGYQFDSKEWFESLGAGLDFRVFEKISAFSDIQYRFANETRDGVFLRLGVRLSF